MHLIIAVFIGLPVLSIIIYAGKSGFAAAEVSGDREYGQEAEGEDLESVESVGDRGQ